MMSIDIQIEHYNPVESLSHQTRFLSQTIDNYTRSMYINIDMQNSKDNIDNEYGKLWHFGTMLDNKIYWFSFTYFVT